MPHRSRPLASSVVTSVNRATLSSPVSLRKKALLGLIGYSPRLSLPPTKRSKSPSLSKSEAATADPLKFNLGNESAGASS